MRGHHTKQQIVEAFKKFGHEDDHGDKNSITIDGFIVEGEWGYHCAGCYVSHKDVDKYITSKENKK